MTPVSQESSDEEIVGRCIEKVQPADATILARINPVSSLFRRRSKLKRTLAETIARIEMKTETMRDRLINKKQIRKSRREEKTSEFQGGDFVELSHVLSGRADFALAPHPA